MKHTGNLTFDEIIKIARAMRERSMAKELTGTVKEVLGMLPSLSYHCLIISLDLDSFSW